MGSDNSIDKDSIGLLENDREACSGKQGKGKRLWKKVKYQLVEYHSLPAFLRDNEYILGHYRSEWPMKQVLLSIFTIHNETLNVWTHLIGFFLFLALTIYTAMKVPQVVDLNSLQHLPDILKNADLHKLQSELSTCLPSMPNLQRLRDEISGWYIKELLYNCFPIFGVNATLQLLKNTEPEKPNYSEINLIKGQYRRRSRNTSRKKRAEWTGYPELLSQMQLIKKITTSTDSLQIDVYDGNS